MKTYGPWVRGAAAWFAAKAGVIKPGDRIKLRRPAMQGLPRNWDGRTMVVTGNEPTNKAGFTFRARCLSANASLGEVRFNIHTDGVKAWSRKQVPG